MFYWALAKKKNAKRKQYDKKIRSLKDVFDVYGENMNFLKLIFCNVDMDEFDIFIDKILHRLIHLSLKIVYFESEKKINIDMLQSLKTLEIVDVYSQTFPSVSELFLLQNLEKLVINGAGCYDIKKTTNLPSKLHTLALSNCYLSGDGFRHFASLLEKQTTITDLNLYGNYAGPKTGCVIGHFLSQKSCSLTNLNIGGCGNLGEDFYKGVMQNVSLKRLILCGCSDIQHFYLAKNISLTYLDILFTSPDIFCCPKYFEDEGTLRELRYDRRKITYRLNEKVWSKVKKATEYILLVLFFRKRHILPQKDIILIVAKQFFNTGSDVEKWSVREME